MIQFDRKESGKYSYLMLLAYSGAVHMWMRAEGGVRREEVKLAQC